MNIFESAIENPIQSLMNKHPQPTTAYNFTVYINHMSFGFTKISGLQRQAESDTILVGGINDRVISLKKQNSAQNVATFSRGVGNRGLVSYLMGCFELGEYYHGDVIVMVKNGSRNINKMFFLEGAYVSKVSYSDLDASSNQVLIETFEVVYEKMTSPNEALTGMADMANTAVSTASSAITQSMGLDG